MSDYSRLWGSINTSPKVDNGHSLLMIKHNNETLKQANKEITKMLKEQGVK